jgi:DNA-binding NtrC family response regulator
VADGSFRADLYYRLNVLPIRLPPLRERLGDLEALVDMLADDIARRSGMPHKALGPDAMERLAQHHWPGNIRELRNVLEQATLMTDDPVLGAAHLPSLGGAAPSPPAAPAGGPVTAMPAGEPLDAAADTPAAMPAEAPAALPTFGGPGVAAGPTPLPPACSLPQAIAALEAAAIREALAATGGNKLAAARRLGISRATLYEKLALYRKDTAALTV